MRIFGKLKTMSAQRLITFLLSYLQHTLTTRYSMRMLGQVTTFHTYCMHFGNIFVNCHELRHRSERIAEISDIETCAYNPYSLICKWLTHIHTAIIKELRLVYSYNINIA